MDGATILISRIAPTALPPPPPPPRGGPADDPFDLVFQWRCCFSGPGSPTATCVRQSTESSARPVRACNSVVLSLLPFAAFRLSLPFAAFSLCFPAFRCVSTAVRLCLPFAAFPLRFPTFRCVFTALAALFRHSAFRSLTTGCIYPRGGQRGASGIRAGRAKTIPADGRCTAIAAAAHLLTVDSASIPRPHLARTSKTGCWLRPRPRPRPRLSLSPRSPGRALILTAPGTWL